MLLTVFLAFVFCGAITLLLISAVAFVQDNRFFSSAPKEALEVLKPRNGELFYGARAMGWVLMILSALTIVGVGVVSIWDGSASSVPELEPELPYLYKMPPHLHQSLFIVTHCLFDPVQTDQSKRHVVIESSEQLR